MQSSSFTDTNSHLHPILEEPGAKELFYIFRDETSGKETYPAGRVFYSDLPKTAT